MYVVRWARFKAIPSALRTRTRGLSLDGDLKGFSNGEMLSAVSAIQGSAGYVAVERVKGILDGRKGSFVLQHLGTMARGVPQMTVAVVPDSGTGGLKGLAGAMTITIETGKHFYEFVYTLQNEP